MMLDSTLTKVDDSRTSLAEAPSRICEFFLSVCAGLSAGQKTLECKYLYDERGSVLFDQICGLPEYYPTRTETSILRNRAADISEALGEGIELVELGSGASTKTRILLSALSKPDYYIPIDISEEFLLDVSAGLRTDYPELEVKPIVGDFMAPLELPIKNGAKRVLFFPGSTIGNLHKSEACDFLRSLRLGTQAQQFLIGVDLKKDRSVLEAAYDDAAGVTAAFNLNLLRRINRELNANFNLANFKHKAIYDEGIGRVEMHLVSQCRQTVRIQNKQFQFAVNETIHTENSYKYDLAEFEILAQRAGWGTVNVWTDVDDRFAVFLLETIP